MSDLPVLVGHRGIGDPWAKVLGIPEESIPAIKWAAEHGADIVEGDVQVSAPGTDGQRVMYMMHDADLHRTTNGTGYTNQRSWNYVKTRWLELPVDKDGNGNDDNTSVRVPSFRQWLAAAKGTHKRVFIEIKNSSIWPRDQVGKLAAEIHKQDMKDRVIIAGSRTRLGYFRSFLSTKRSMSVGDYPPVSEVKAVVGPIGYGTIRLTEAEAKPEYVKYLQDAGIHVFLWTLSNSGHYARALPFGAYGWMCNNASDAREWLTTHAG